MTSSPHGPYVLGYTRATMVSTTGSKTAKLSKSLKIPQFGCTLQLECMAQITSNRGSACHGEWFPGLVHTARHTMGVGSTLRQGFKPLDHGIVSDWGDRNKVAVGEPAAGYLLSKDE